jgi:CDP-diacylglycerol--serine O-phosphatidyltransferase
MATLGNAVSGFYAMYQSSLPQPNFAYAAYLIALAMIFDVLDGRLARFTRHTTDFGGQLDSLADVVSFGAAPAFVALRLFTLEVPNAGSTLTQLIMGISFLYLSCAAVRLARFNVSNEHGEQHHFSFLGLPSPGAAGTVASLILMYVTLTNEKNAFLNDLAKVCLTALPIVVVGTGLLMVSHLRYPHIVNRYLRGKRSIGRLILVFSILLLFLVAHQYTLGIGTLAYALYGPVSWVVWQIRRKSLQTSGEAVPQK